MSLCTSHPQHVFFIFCDSLCIAILGIVGAAGRSGVGCAQLLCCCRGHTQHQVNRDFTALLLCPSGVNEHTHFVRKRPCQCDKVCACLVLRIKAGGRGEVRWHSRQPRPFLQPRYPKPTSRTTYTKCFSLWHPYYHITDSPMNIFVHALSSLRIGNEKNHPRFHSTLNRPSLHSLRQMHTHPPRFAVDAPTDRALFQGHSLPRADGQEGSNGITPPNTTKH